MNAVAVIVAIFIAVPAFGNEVPVRDWTIEKPVVAGFLSGLSLVACRSFRLGSQSTPASAHDPFGMSPQVHGQLVSLAQRPYCLGQAVGVFFTLFVISGVLFRRLNTLKLDTTIESGS